MCRLRKAIINVTTAPHSSGGVLNGGINASVTAITMDDTSGILDGDTILIDAEQITVTTVLNGTTLSVVVRGVNGTTAAAHLTAAPVYNLTDGLASGTGESDKAIVGEVVAVYVNFHASAPATTDTTVKTTGVSGGIPSATLWAISNSATDVTVYPRAKPVDNANSAISNAFTPFAVADRITVALAQCDSLTDAAVVTVLYKDMTG